MAKKKASSEFVSPLAAAARRAADNVKSIVEATKRPLSFNAGSGSTAVGLAIPFPLQYLLGCGILPLGILMEVNGEQQSCKTMFTYELGRFFAEAGGWLDFIVTEAKISEDLAHSVIGWSDERRAAFNSYMASDMAVWQRTLQTRIKDTIDMVKKGDKETGLEAGARYPVMFCVDSIMGANLPETNARIEENGFAGRAHPAEALSLTTYLKTVANLLTPYPFLAVFINHLKIDKDASNPYAEVTKRRPGGRQLRFQETFELNMYRQKTEITLDKGSKNGLEIHRRLIKMENAKNSIGTDGRTIQVYVSWQKRNIEGRSYQFTKWDWNEATTRMLIMFQEGKLIPKMKLAESTLRARLDEFFHIRKTPKGYFSDTLGIPSSAPVTAGQMGKLINESTDAMEKLRLAFGIPSHSLWTPGTDYTEQRRTILAKEQEEEAKRMDALRAALLEDEADSALNVEDELEEE